MKWLEKIILLFPRSTALALGRFLGRIAYYLFKKRRKIAIENLKLSLALPNPEKIIKKLFENLGMNFIEFLRFPEITAENLSQFVTIHNREILDKGFQQKKGILALTAHMGNWELLQAAICLLDYNTTVVVKKIRHSFVNDYLQSLRESKKVKLLSGKHVVKDILKQLQVGGMVGFVLDQHAKRSEGVVVPFFGRDAWTFKSLAILSQRTDATIIPIYIYRDENYHHHIMIESPIEHNDSDDIETRTQKYTAWIESAIKQHPDQWIWTHQRWKKNP